MYGNYSGYNGYNGYTGMGINIASGALRGALCKRCAKDPTPAYCAGCTSAEVGGAEGYLGIPTWGWLVGGAAIVGFGGWYYFLR